MSDYIIEQYNAKFVAAMEDKKTALNGATQLYYKTVDEIMGRWQARMVEAAIEMDTAFAHRDRFYREGPPPPEPERKDPDPPEDTTAFIDEAQPPEEPIPGDGVILLGVDEAQPPEELAADDHDD